MDEYRLTRTGDAPLVFQGELLAEQSGKWHANRERLRRVDLRLYRTAGGQYVLERVYVSQWDGEAGRAEAIVLGPEPHGVVEELRSWDPASLQIGYPPGKGYEEKQTRLLAELRSLYEHRLSAILEALPGAEERIE